MGRWTQYDEDDYRLPEGVKRIGYDADTGRYYFSDREGLVYRGPEGSEFGELTQVGRLMTDTPWETYNKRRTKNHAEHSPIRESSVIIATPPAAVSEGGDGDNDVEAAPARTWVTRIRSLTIHGRYLWLRLSLGLKCFKTQISRHLHNLNHTPVA